MGEQELFALEEASGRANQAFMESYGALQQASDRSAAAKEAYQSALNEMENGYNQIPTKEQQENLRRAREELTAAEEAQKAAEGKYEETAQAAQEASDAVQAKKEALRASRATDTTYVVHGARMECSCGMRESYLLLEHSHGVLTRGIPQMTVKDFRLNENIINFGGCTSTENPSTQEAAQKAVQAANQAIQEEKKNEGFLGKVVSCFAGDGKMDTKQIDDSVISQCMGECIAKFAAKEGWRKGHEKVTVNGDAPLLRRCELDCIYGGRITILISGQPE